jgi:membrane-bound serine protease (ClpP class)
MQLCFLIPLIEREKYNAYLIQFCLNFGKLISRMNIRVILYFLLFIALPVLLPAQKVLSITIDGAISPAVTNFIERSIKKAEQSNAECLIIKLNTPGGLLKSTRTIVGNILDSPIPIVVFVSPNGAQAGSAGVFITMAAHIAAMAPGTNIGAAHPVSAQGGISDTTMNQKITNDALAFIRIIAEKRGRNKEWAELAVSNSVSITSTEALQLKVVDLVANNTRELLTKIEGRVIELNNGPVTLHTQSSVIEEVEMSFAEKVLQVISDPNLAYILLMLGFYGLLFEIYSPGAIIPGIVGVIGLILGLYSLNTLPVNYAGLALIVFGIILFLLEIKVTSYGLLTIGGIIALFLGSLMLIRTDSLLQISRGLIIGFTIVSALFFLLIIGAGIRAQKRRPVTGMEGFIGSTGITLEELDPRGSVQVNGEIWQAESLSGKIEKGEQVSVKSLKDFKAFVERV